MTQPGPRNERIVPRLIEDELRDSFIDYSMSVIVQRALPDARDGLKPVHRRILYAMYEQRLLPERDHRKSATVVGEVLGKYHPHGDSAVYDTLVRMVQSFSLRYPLIDGQGNFGSIDGDSAAAYRYTEARLAPIAVELLADLDSNTVDFAPNFDGRTEEPVVLPARLPSLLLNGSDGIAVGMATKIPPHNLAELVDTTLHLLWNPECEIEDLAGRLEGPDFPTGGYIWGYGGIGDAYRTGRGLIEMRARMHLEEGAYGKQSLVVTELPYQVNKSRVIGQITKIVRSGRVDSITDLRDESDRDGLRLVIELKRDADVDRLVRTLFLKTQLKSTFGVIMLALVDGRPVQLNLKQALSAFVDHRLEVITRRAADEMAEAEDRAHVLEGLLLALEDIDRVIALIRESTSPPVAADRLCATFSLSKRQAEAILAMRLARLTQLEGRKLQEELEELERRIDELRLLVERDDARRQLLAEELTELARRFGDARRTRILDESGTFPLPSEDDATSSLVLLTRQGYVKAQPVRGGGERLLGAEAMEERQGDVVVRAWLGRSESELLVFTSTGRVKSVNVADLPAGTRAARGRLLAESLELEDGEEVLDVHPVPDTSDERFVLTVTRRGQVKRTSLAEFGNVRGGGIIATGIAPGDELLAVHLTDGASDVVLLSRSGQVIRFDETEIRPMGRSARGVRGMDLEDGDEVAAALVPRPEADLVVATSRGRVKRFPVTEVRRQGRAGKGLSSLADASRAGHVVGALSLDDDGQLAFELDTGGLLLADSRDIEPAERRGTARPVPGIATGAGVLGVLFKLGGTRGPASGTPVPVEVAEVATEESEETEESEGGVSEPATQGELGFAG